MENLSDWRLARMEVFKFNQVRYALILGSTNQWIAKANMPTAGGCKIVYLRIEFGQLVAMEWNGSPDVLAVVESYDPTQIFGKLKPFHCQKIGSCLGC